MRVMVMVRADEQTEAGCMPSTQLLTEMHQYNEELVKSGVLLAGEGLQPSSHGKRVNLAGKKVTVVDGPFAEAKELIAGFWIWQVKSLDEAVEWARRIPNPDGDDVVVDIRPVMEAEDFGEEFTPDLQAKEAQLRSQLETGVTG